jgi:phosphoribosyl-ATP pyrophosphohydrolase
METEILNEVFEVILDRKRNPKKESYVSRLLAEGRAGDKVLEEAEELVKAAREEGREEVIHEAADLIFHTMVLIAERDIHLKDIMEELRRRRR